MLPSPPMDWKIIFFYTWIVLGILFVLSFILLAIPKIKDVIALEDPWAWFKDSRITHKVAELLIWIPFFFIILWSLYRSPAEVTAFVERVDWIMIIGGVLSAYSFFDARNKYWWAYGMWGLAIWGIFGPWFSINYLIPFLGAW